MKNTAKRQKTIEELEQSNRTVQHRLLQLIEETETKLNALHQAVQELLEALPALPKDWAGKDKWDAALVKVTDMLSDRGGSDASWQ
jgi:hypothetical protein